MSDTERDVKEKVGNVNREIKQKAVKKRWTMGMGKVKAFLNVKEALEEVKASGGELSGVVDDEGPTSSEKSMPGKNENRAGAGASAVGTGEGDKSKERGGFFKRFVSTSKSPRSPSNKQGDNNFE
jgi:hypothetical protein